MYAQSYRRADATLRDVGLEKHTIPDGSEYEQEWNYATLADPPPSLHSGESEKMALLYRGIVPAKHIAQRDLAVAGAIVSMCSNRLWQQLSTHGS